MKKFFIIFSVLMSYSIFAGDFHIVEKGDTLYSIARTYKISVDKLIEKNSLSSDGKIKIGQKIKINFTDEKNQKSISKSSIYIVEKGDTLYSIARKFGMKVDDLKSINSLNSNTIKLGQKLVCKAPSSNVIASTKSETKKPVKVTTEVNIKTEVKETNKIINTGNDKWPVKGHLKRTDGKLNGVEIVTSSNATVVSVSPGEVVGVMPYRGFDYVIMVENSNKRLFSYGGLAKVYPKEGDKIKAGDKLGTVAKSTRDNAYRVFLFVYEEGKAIDPFKVPKY